MNIAKVNWHHQSLWDSISVLSFPFLDFTSFRNFLLSRSIQYSVNILPCFITCFRSAMLHILVSHVLSSKKVGNRLWAWSIGFRQKLNLARCSSSYLLQHSHSLNLTYMFIHICAYTDYKSFGSLAISDQWTFGISLPFGSVIIYLPVCITFPVSCL